VATIEVEGKNRLEGELKVHGSKNAVLPILAASILHKGKSVIHNCPAITDVYCMIELLKCVGCIVEYDNRCISVDASQITNTRLDEEHVTKFRSSIILLGSMLGRVGEICIAYPGGCSIGERPINYHLMALGKMNTDIYQNEESLCAKTSQLIGQEITLEFPSVGANENIILAAVLARGVTTIHNAAREPEICELCRFLSSMGAKISGDGTSEIRIEGVHKLHDTEFTVASDRILVATYGCAVACTGGEIQLKNVCLNHLEGIVPVLKQIGCKIRAGDQTLIIQGEGMPKPIPYIRTCPYPGFPTDMQSQLMVALAISDGNFSSIEEKLFESRFKTCDELIKMGANIQLEGQIAKIYGVSGLKGAEVFAQDLRGGAALVIAGLIAEGKTKVQKIGYIERGYENIVDDLKKLNAKIHLM